MFDSFRSYSKGKKIAILITVLFALFYVIKESFGHGDFTLFLKASEQIRDGVNPYDKWMQIEGENYSRYFYSPLWGILLIPFTYLPFIVARFAWLLLNVWFLYRIWHLLAEYLQLDRLTETKRTWLLVLTAALSLRFILYNFDLVQMTLFLLWGMLESLKMIDQRRFMFGGLLLGFVINVKVMPLVLIPYLLYRKKFIPVVLVIASFGLFLALPALVTGWEFNLVLLNEWWSVIDPSIKEHKFEAQIGPHSLTALIPTLLMETEGRLDVARNIVNLSEEYVSITVRIVQGMLISFTLFFVGWPPFRNAKSKAHYLYEIAYLALIIPLIFPHQQKYAFVLALPAQFYQVYYLLKSQSGMRWNMVATFVSMSFILMTLTTDGIIGKELNLLSRHFKLVTYGMFFLIFGLALANPNNLGHSEAKSNLQ